MDRLTAVVLDKTGTVTEGQPAVTDVFVPSGREADRRALLRLAAAAESGSEHPLARALAPYRDPADAVTEFQAVRGAGVAGEGRRPDRARRVGAIPERVGGRPVAAWPTPRSSGKARRRPSCASPPAASRSGAIALADTLKPHAREVVDRLGRAGADVYLVTGDNPQTARAVAAALGIASDRVFAGVSPEGKAAKVAELRAQGRPRRDGRRRPERRPRARRGRRRDRARAPAPTWPRPWPTS